MMTKVARGLVLLAVLVLGSGVPAHAQSWTDPTPLNTDAATDSHVDLDPQIATDGHGTWVAVWESSDPVLGGDLDIVFARSTDDGATWSDPAPLNTNAASDSAIDGLPELTTDGAGTWVAVWWRCQDCTGTFSDEDVLVARSTDGGATWSDPRVLSHDAASDGGLDIYPQVTTDRMGTWVAVWHSNDPGGGLGTDFDVVFARSTDGGENWSAPQPLNTNATFDSGDDQFPQLTTDGHGRWEAVWRSNDDLGGTIGADLDILFARSADGGATWSDPRPLNSNAGSPTGNDLDPQLATDGQGTWLAVWTAADPGSEIGFDGDIVFARSTDGGATWSERAPVNSDATTDTRFDLLPRIATDALGTWLAIWSATSTTGGPLGSDFDILFARSTDAGATWSDPEPLNAYALGDSAFDYGGRVTTDGLVTWLAVWQSNYDLGGGTDADILIARGRSIGACVPGPRVLCLDDARFRVTARWSTNQGTSGPARAEPLTADTGYFWFFNPANVEMVVKVLDACVPPFDRFWVFAGGLTNVEVETTVVDTAADAVRTYTNPQGTPFQPLQDTGAFDTCAEGMTAPGIAPLPRSAHAPPSGLAGVTSAPGQGTGTCAPDATTLCLNDGRFRVTARWRTPQGTLGDAQAEPLTGDTGYFWFFNPANVEMVVKVLDACVPPFEHYWVFAGGLTNVEVETTVVDTATGEEQVYPNPLGMPFQPIQDTGAFATCP